MLSTETASYTRTAKFLHWVIGLAILFMLALGWGMGFVPREAQTTGLMAALFGSGPLKVVLINLHKSTGIVILLLSLLRIIWRVLHKAPPLPAHFSPLERRVMHAVHGLLYLGMIGLPLTGWALSSTSPYKITLYGLFPWPNLPLIGNLDAKDAIHDAMKESHETGAIILAALVALHVAAALKHHFIGKDNSLLSITPRCCASFLTRLRRG